MTRIQKAILDIVKSSKQHLSATQVYDILKAKFPSVSLGSVYRNLNQFADSGLIRRVSRLNAADFYEGNTKPHDHSVCACCGKVSDIHIPGMKEFIESNVNGKMVSFDLIVNIICPGCADKNEDTREDEHND